mmetsp:Transcript_6816/g.19185  ORF Transcript_6816/g.19185 Transcript_6816/m.19185 type:complete len:458 (+) Transcript_6816:864-2237(+)
MLVQYALPSAFGDLGADVRLAPPVVEGLRDAPLPRDRAQLAQLGTHLQVRLERSVVRAQGRLDQRREPTARRRISGRESVRREPVRRRVEDPGRVHAPAFALRLGEPHEAPSLAPRVRHSALASKFQGPDALQHGLVGRVDEPINYLLAVHGPHAGVGGRVLLHLAYLDVLEVEADLAVFHVQRLHEVLGGLARVLVWALLASRQPGEAIPTTAVGVGLAGLDEQQGLLLVLLGAPDAQQHDVHHAHQFLVAGGVQHEARLAAVHLGGKLAQRARRTPAEAGGVDAVIAEHLADDVEGGVLAALIGRQGPPAAPARANAAVVQVAHHGHGLLVLVLCLRHQRPLVAPPDARHVVRYAEALLQEDWHALAVALLRPPHLLLLRLLHALHQLAAPLLHHDVDPRGAQPAPGPQARAQRLVVRAHDVDAHGVGAQVAGRGAAQPHLRRVRLPLQPGVRQG